MNQPFSTGAHESPYDERTWQHESDKAVPLIQGGYHYLPQDIEHQHNVGICTAISLVQNAEKALGKKFSPDFQYLLQKKFYDIDYLGHPDWSEGSSIFSALKVGKNYGFLPLELFPHVTEHDRQLPYSQYVAKLQAIPEAEVQRLISLCTDKLTGYAQVNIDAQSLATAINDSVSGILTRYVVGEEWWTARDGRVSWAEADINPLRPPVKPVSGHAIGTSYFDLVVNQMFEHPNTWGTDWNRYGLGDTNHANYKCTEAWIPYYTPVTPTPQPTTPKFQFVRNLGLWSWGSDVVKLQQLLVAEGCGNFTPTGLFGAKTLEAVKAYQVKHGVTPVTGYVGPLTRAKLNT